MHKAITHHQSLRTSINRRLSALSSNERMFKSVSPINAQSNHPPSIIKNIPLSINRRLSALSSNERMFKSVSPIYQEALDKAGYKFQLKFQPVLQNQKEKRKRKRRITWWNPPFSLNVKTKVGAKFFKLLDKHFPKSNPLSKIINRRTVKMSYRTTSNFKRIISSHNQKVLNPPEPSLPCNCRKKDECPMEGGRCREQYIVYQATVSTTEPGVDVETYTGMTKSKFKERYANHKKIFQPSRILNRNHT